jgi:secreted PhoX family phosphatase
MTCRYRCANACDEAAPNVSDNRYFGDVLQEGLTRRGLLRAGALAGLVVGSGVHFLGTATALAGDDDPAATALRGTGDRLTFPPVAPNTLDTVVVPDGYDWAPLIVWGDPVVPGAPRFDVDEQTAAAQSRQFGYNNDFLALLPLPGSRDRALLVVNHEYTNEELMFRGWAGGAKAPVEQLRVAMAAHGFSVVAVERVGDSGRWRVSRHRDRYNRRVTMSTRMRLTGPAAGHPLLRTGADPSGRVVLGTLNNCAGGVTPWGTTLHGEENFHGYFTDPDAVPAHQAAAFERYSIGVARDDEDYRGWDRADRRFDIAKEANEANRFGWIVELDPFDKTSTPRKRTMLGRFKHEGANIQLTDEGHAVAYMGDDEAFEYVYKFVSRKRYRSGRDEAARRHNLSLLDSGTLYVAKFTGDSPKTQIDGSAKLPSDGEFDGTGTWLPLASDTRSYVPGFSVAEVLIHTRLAADAVGKTQSDGVGATKMDRPEDVEPHPVTGRIYCALTKNAGRTATQVDEANPRAANKHGHIVEIAERDDDAAATRFTWRLFLVAGDPKSPDSYFGGFDKSQVSPISCPDNVAFDPGGNLWIATDGNALGSNDGLYAVPTRGSRRGQLKAFLTVPPGAECCGPVISRDGRTALVAVQHPGELEGATLDEPASTFPDGEFARPAVVVVWRTGSGSKRIGA